MVLHEAEVLTEEGVSVVCVRDEASVLRQRRLTCIPRYSTLGNSVVSTYVGGATVCSSVLVCDGGDGSWRVVGSSTADTEVLRDCQDEVSCCHILVRRDRLLLSQCKAPESTELQARKSLTRSAGVQEPDQAMGSPRAAVVDLEVYRTDHRQTSSKQTRS